MCSAPIVSTMGQCDPGIAILPAEVQRRIPFRSSRPVASMFPRVSRSYSADGNESTRPASGLTVPRKSGPHPNRAAKPVIQMGCSDVVSQVPERQEQADGIGSAGNTHKNASAVAEHAI